VYKYLQGQAHGGKYSCEEPNREVSCGRVRAC